MHATLPPELPAAPAAPKPFQFNLRHLLAVTAAVCVAGAGYHWVGPGVLFILVPLLLIAVVLITKRTVEALVVIGLAAILVGLLLPAVGSGPVSPRAQCSNNLRQIAIALQDYHAAKGHFPPAYIADANGKPMHSWRVLLLPYIRPDIYQAYRFDEPWDGPNNRQFASQVISLFECPAGHSAFSGETSYVAVVGPGTAWPGAKGVAHSDIKDGASNTILIVEVQNSGIHWMEPRDLDASQMPLAINAKPVKGVSPGISSGHRGVALVALADGSILTLSDDTPPATVRAMLTIAGGEQVTPP